MEPTPGEDAVSTGKTTTKGSECYINLVDEAGAGFVVMKKVLLWVECYQTALHVTEKLFTKGRVGGCGTLHCCPVLRSRRGHLNLQQAPPWSAGSRQH